MLYNEKLQRKLKTLENFLKSWGSETLEQIEEVSMDLEELCYFGILLIVWHNKSGRTDLLNDALRT